MMVLGSPPDRVTWSMFFVTTPGTIEGSITGVKAAETKTYEV
jgi:hypothetical protein